MKKKILTIVGARPQFVKAAALSRLFQKNTFFEEVLVHTGQHFDANMSEIFFEELQIPKPHYMLEISGSSHGAMTGRMLEQLENVMNIEKPDAVLVYGDTNSTLAGALAASKLHIPVIHVEAGLRSFNRSMPEETNRVLTDHVSAFLFCPTQTSITNLAREGIENGVYAVGDIMGDTVRFAKQTLETNPDVVTLPSESEKPFALLTLHREDTTSSLKMFHERFAYALKEAHENGLHLIFPAHPRTRKLLIDTKDKNVSVIEPVGYLTMQALLSKASLVLTDSGGLQKEAYFHQVPCVTLRSETEWIETVQCGWNRLWKKKSFKSRKPILDYGTGNAAEKILNVLKTEFCEKSVGIC